MVAENLWEDSVYEATVEAANQFGWSNKSKIFYISTSRRGICPFLFFKEGPVKIFRVDAANSF
jgi:hypothetical protein